MSVERRDQLVEDIVKAQPELRVFVRRLPNDMLAGSWDLLAYSFQRGFEVMWDHERSDSSGLLLRPANLQIHQQHKRPNRPHKRREAEQRSRR